MCSGANAIYLGSKKFSARQNAENFDRDTLKEVVSYCHRFSVSVYLAINTTVFDDELDDVASTIKTAVEVGIDALIIQDMGVLAMAKKVCPTIPLHASTQMSVQSIEGVKRLEDMGFSRVVLARELSLDEIEKIAKNTKAELEVFVHGALCMSVSGQCYLSSMIGRRSGNRGLCAQPCRLPFGVKNPSDCALSLKDLSGLSHIKKLSEIGVISFKIEGRMKRPEYVAAAVSAVKNAIENGTVSDDEMIRLRSVFSRSGFTDGYLTGKRFDMFGTRQKEDVTSAPQYLKELQSLYAKDVPRFAVNIKANIAKDKPLTITAKSGEFVAEYKGDLASGTDAGAWAVPHGSLTEFSLLESALGDRCDEVLDAGIAVLKR